MSECKEEVVSTSYHLVEVLVTQIPVNLMLHDEHLCFCQLFPHLIKPEIITSNHAHRLTLLLFLLVILTPLVETSIMHRFFFKPLTLYSY